MNHLITFTIVNFFIFQLAAQDPSQFDINDPRNPKCPCHKHQKLADDEYKMLLTNAAKTPIQLHENKNAGSGINENIKDLTNYNDTFVSSGNSDTKKFLKKKKRTRAKHHRKKRGKKHPLWNRIVDVKGWDIWKEFINATACYHWK